MSTHIPGDDHEREPIATSGTADHPHARLDPVVEADLSWGNEVAEDWHVTDPRFEYWGLTPARPFHVDALRERFRFPYEVSLYVVGGRRRKDVPMMHLMDRLGVARVSAPVPDGWPNADLAVPLTPDEPGDGRRPIAARGWRQQPQAHLEPVVHAELSWGNRIQSPWQRGDKLLDDRTLTLAEPFHVEKLRRTFRFPANIGLWAVLPRPGHRHERARMVMSDSEEYVTIHTPLPDEWPHGEGEVAL
ncbi:hypothetical protein VSR01_36080 [Actinacidiphila sp. DG2A-62]|uniref:hypothetical protein n=1 Tax=Actinacidiphila sp. DG2A-62 TaxID=3108821 RepID=UPI002DBA31CC|nr:hypothetical protein [Actinacidiphila sp. DG2A-62]MEC3998616.1 hypothetical protein [Actinacidiphila sp. DG2A-62]